MTGSNDRDDLLARMEEALDIGLGAAEWRELLRALARRDDARDLLRLVDRSAEACEDLRGAFDSAPVPPGLADRIKGSLAAVWRRPAPPPSARRLSFDELDQLAAAGSPDQTQPPVPDLFDDDPEDPKV